MKKAGVAGDGSFEGRGVAVSLAIFLMVVPLELDPARTKEPE